MNWAWWDGKVSEHHYREEHGLDSETLLAAARAESHPNGDGNGKESAVRNEEEDEKSEPISHN